MLFVREVVVSTELDIGEHAIHPINAVIIPLALAFTLNIALEIYLAL